MASPSFRAKATGGNATAANVTCNVPAGTADNDILLVQLSKDDTAAVTWPGGWNILSEDTANSFYQGIGWRRASSEPANYTWTFTSIWRDIVILSYQSAVTGETPLDPDVPPAAVANTGIAPTITTNNDVTTTADTVGVAFANFQAISTWGAAPGSWVARQEVADNEVHAMDLVVASGTITGPSLTTSGGSGAYKGYIVALQSVTSGAPPTPATRFRLPASGTPEVSPTAQSYTHTGGVARPLVTTDASALATTAVTPDAADHIAAGDTYHFQGVSPMLAGQVISSGAVAKLAIQCLEAHTNNNLFVQLWIGIYNQAGTSLLATLLAKTLDGTELATSITNRFMNPSTTAGYTCTGGERLVVEISVSGTPVATSGTQGHNASLRFGSNGGGGDGGANDTDTGATLNPWFELNPGVLFFKGPTLVQRSQAVGRAALR
jgi:hypothetical protein